MAYREIQLPEALQELHQEYLSEVSRAFQSEDAEERARQCQRLLAEIYFPGQDHSQLLAAPDLPVGSRLALLQLDPNQVVLEFEIYDDVDPAKYACIKPLIWFWVMFDRSPMGRNTSLGFAVRQILAEFVFDACGKNLKIFDGVEFTWGYKLQVGDDSELHRNVFLDDRGGLKVGKGVTISDGAHIFTHTHDAEDRGDVSCYETVIGDGSRVSFQSTLLAGASMGTNSMLAADSLATRSIPRNWVWGGIPAKPLKEKEQLGST